MTYRERREARAERLRGWAEKREQKSAALHDQADRLASVIPFGQPILVGHHSEGRDRRYRARIGATMDRAVENDRTARRMAATADEIERQARNAIYSDDPDAPERLAEKIGRLEAQRDAIKAANAEYRKAHRAELAALTAYQRDHALPHRSFETTNLTANIGRLRKRLEGMTREQ